MDSTKDETVMAPHNSVCERQLDLEFPACPMDGCSYDFLEEFADTGGLSVETHLKSIINENSRSGAVLRGAAQLLRLFKRPDSHSGTTSSSACDSQGLGDSFTIADACNTVIKPHTLRFRSSMDRSSRVQDVPSSSLSYAQLAAMTSLKDRRGNSAFKDLATHFVSHAWNSDFKHFVKALRFWLFKNNYPMEDAYFWVDAFVINQNCSIELPQKWWSTRFMQGIQKIGTTILVLDRWQQPQCLQRAWVLWEIYCTTVCGSKLELTMHPDTLEDFEQALGNSFEVVQDALSNICVKQTKAFNAVDQEMIHKEIHRSIGFTSMNELVQAKLQNLLLDMAKRRLQERKIKEKVFDNFTQKKHRLMLELNLAIFVRERGNIQDAEKTFRRLLGELFPAFGQEDSLSSKCLFQLAVTLQKGGKMNEALQMHESCLKLRRTVLGKQHPDTLQSLANVALTRSEIKPLSETLWQLARAELTDAIDGQEAILGQSHPQTLASLSNMGRLLSKAPNVSAELLEEAQYFHDRACEELEVKGITSKHPMGLTALYNQAQNQILKGTIQNDKQLLESAVNQLQRVLLGRTEKCGMAHPETVETGKVLREARCKVDAPGGDLSSASWQEVAYEACPEVCSAMQLKKMRAVLRHFDINRLRTELVEQRYIDQATSLLTTKLQPFNFFARLAAGVSTQPANDALQSKLGEFQDRYLIACNRPEAELMWNSEDPAWLGKANLAKRHVIMTVKDLHWEWYNILTFGFVSGIEKGLEKLKEMREAATHWASEMAEWQTEDKLGFYMSCSPHTRVKAMQLHILDMTCLGPSFLRFRSSYLSINAAIEALEQELAESRPQSTGHKKAWMRGIVSL